MRKLLATASAAGLIAVGLMASPASADPPSDGGASTLDCGTGGSYDIVIAPGSGKYTPAFDTASNRVFIPVSFGPSTFTLRDHEGTIIESISDDGADRAGRRVGVQGKIMNCTYLSTFSFVDPDMGTVHGTAEGQVYGFASH